VINRRRLITLAMDAANHDEWGYDSAEALANLQDIDPTHDWEMELLQAELEENYRTMGPHRPRTRTEMDLVLEAVYRPAMERLFEQTDTLVKWMNRDTVIDSRRDFTIPLHIKKNDSEPV
jgi:hypothetical protein